LAAVPDGLFGEGLMDGFLHHLPEIFDHLAVPDLYLVEKIARPVLVYAFLLIGLRLAGKRELAQLSSMDLIVLMTLSNTVQNAIIGNDNSVFGGIVGASTLLLCNYLVVRFLFRHEKLDRLIEGEATTLIDNGRILDEAMQKELITPSELKTAAHKQGFSSLDEVESAQLEPGGVISFVAHKPEPDVQRHEQLLERLDQLGRELGKLRAKVDPSS
jgi:uncharacterized membrane protein YcaP (DUF421 family)